MDKLIFASFLLAFFMAESIFAVEPADEKLLAEVAETAENSAAGRVTHSNSSELATKLFYWGLSDCT